MKWLADENDVSERAQELAAPRMGSQSEIHPFARELHCGLERCELSLLRVIQHGQRRIAPQLNIHSQPQPLYTAPLENR